MNSLLDILGATIIGGLIYLLLFQVNARISTNASDILVSTFSSRNAVDAGTLLEFDMSKIGYRVSNNVITIAQQRKIEFWSDLFDNDSTVKVCYFLGNTNQLTGTTNPNDRPLYRYVTGSDTLLVSVVRDFTITYFDSAQNVINYASLTTQAGRNNIRGTKLYCRIETTDPSEGEYPFIEFKRTIFPKNLGRK